MWTVLLLLKTTVALLTVTNYQVVDVGVSKKAVAPSTKTGGKIIDQEFIFIENLAVKPFELDSNYDSMKAVSYTHLHYNGT